VTIKLWSVIIQIN